MLYEDDVIDAVCDHLQRHGFTIRSKCASTMRGDDIVAHGTGSIRELYIEAKGGTSNRNGSLRHGQSFNDSQVLDHVANAFYRAAKMATNGRTGGIALPANEAHQNRIAAIAHAIEHLAIIVFWVADDRTVTTSKPLLP
jgi:hypothetical protein